MKTVLSLSLALVALAPAQAQVFRPEAVNGALLGGVAGAVIGNNSGDLHHNAWKGAAIGAGAGLILGEAIGNANVARTDAQVARPEGYIYRSAPTVRVGVGYGYGGDGYYGRRHGYYGGYYSYAPSYGYYTGYDYPVYDDYGTYGTGNAATNGLLLGALAGGIIGNNSGEFRHNGWRGAAWGAGAGWLLGTILDANRRPVVYRAAPAVVAQPAAQPAQPATVSPQPVTIINNYYNPATPMSGANSLFGR